MSQESKRRITNLCVATLSLAATLRCNVYNDTLLGKAELVVGGQGHSGSAGGATAGAGHAGIAGESAAGTGGGNTGLGGFSEMAGAPETGGTETSGGSGGTTNGGTTNGGTTNGGTTTGGTTNGGTTTGGTTTGGTTTGGAGGAIPTASGCAKLSVPLDDAGDKAHFVIGLASPVDLSGATVSMRIYMQDAKGGTIFNYVQDSGTYHFLGVPSANRQPLSSASGWTTISWNVGAEPDADGTGIVKTSIKSIGIEINAQPSSTWSNPTIVY
ncbi:MAG TPA: hypothetical protein VFK05_31990, partial [Polyangiaceae bacterium]|nr:hypothetical protein [Polyangiaceae bacterium]